MQWGCGIKAAWAELGQVLGMGLWVHRVNDKENWRQKAFTASWILYCLKNKEANHFHLLILTNSLTAII